MIIIREIKDKKNWEDFLADQPFTSFFQSWNWGLVQERIGAGVLRWGIYQNQSLLGLVQIIIVKAKRGTFLHVRHGPVLRSWQKEIFRCLHEEMIITGRALKADFIRFSPLLLKSDVFLDFLEELGWKDSPVHILDAEYDWILDLATDEKDLFAGMRKTTRYQIRQAVKQGIGVVVARTKQDFQEFMDLYDRTALRQKFGRHKSLPEEYEIFKKDHQAKLYLAKMNGRILSGALIISCHRQAFYHHGASRGDKFSGMASSLLQWQIIREAKEEKMKLYNLWGVAPPGQADHPWAGLTLFKSGFGGKLTEYAHCLDYPLTRRYFFIFLYETFWKWRKGY